MKKILLKILAIYDLFIISALVIVALKSARSFGQVFLGFLFLPIFFFFTMEIKKKIFKFRGLLIGYGLVLGIIATVANLMSIRNWGDLWLNLILIPLPIYFVLSVKKHKKNEVIESEIVNEEEKIEVDNSKRKFLKLLTSTGLATVILYFLNAKKTQAAFFGSVPGSGTISIKDSGGNKINPAVNSPTDGFGIVNVDDAAYPNFYGFVNKDGNWYIQKENENGSFDFANINNNPSKTTYGTAWSDRESLTFNSFDVAF